MKRHFYILFALILALVSCTQELDIQHETPSDCIMLRVSNSPMTKAVAAEGLEYERQLKRLDCFFYVKGQTGSPCVYYEKVDLSEVGDAVIPIYVDEATINTIFPYEDICDVFLIANLPNGTYESGKTGTDIPTLEKTFLNLDGTYDAVDKPFVMWGEGIAEKGDDNNAAGEIKLYRAAAKVTISINIPAQIKTTLTTVNGDGTTTETEKILTPILQDADGNLTFKTAFHYGVNKTYLHTDYVDSDGESLLTEDDYFATEKKGYKYVSTIPATGTAPEKYVYTCEVPFYTYARAWEKAASDAAYLTLELPWRDEEAESNDTYYYQILINGAGRTFEPNSWYDLNVNVGVLGSTVESKPTVIEDLTYYILDWTTEPESEGDSGDRYEDVVIQNYTYLIVPEKRLEINNATSGVIKFDASHKLGFKMNTASKPVEILPGKTTSEVAFYVNCGTTPPSVANLGINTGNFTLDNTKGTLTYNYTIPSNVFSPVYVYITIWLDIDGDGILDTNEEEFTENVSIVQYPPLYIVPEESVTQSVYVNGRRATNSSHNVIYVNGQTYDLGGAPGSDNSKYMHTINVSSFTGNNTFELHGQKVSYIIGDPRVRVSDINLNNDGYDMAETNSWAADYYGRRLEYYYPTGTEGEVYRVISPKFRVSSKLGGYSEGDREGVMMRCASYQENGYPAGRWRVPTTAEIAFIVYLQSQNAIPELFVDNHYFSSTHMVTQGDGKEDIEDIDDDDHSVRCVYDEWYWGSEQEAAVNQNLQPTQGGYYYYTWGDKQIWDNNGNPL